MPRPKKLPPFVPIPWISDTDTSSRPQSAEECSAVEDPLHEHGVHPGLHILDEHLMQPPQSVALPPLRLPIDAERPSQRFPGQSQASNSSNSSSTHLPTSTFTSHTVNESDPSSSPSSSENSDNEFSKLLDDLVKQWLLVELTNNVSKHATDAFWRLALKFFPLLTTLPANGKKILQFQQLRKKLYSEYVPDISMCVTFEERETNQLHHLMDITSIPKNRFPPHQYKKLYETAKVKVITYFISKVHELSLFN